MRRGTVAVAAAAVVLLALLVLAKVPTPRERYTAVIVEPRKHKAMGFVLQNILENLPSDSFDVLIFHGTENQAWLERLLATSFSESQRARVRLQSLGVANLTIQDYNVLLTSPSFYRAIPTDGFLLFQTDSMICPAFKDRIWHYIQYDYVGAPWTNKSMSDRIAYGDIEPGNGGFCWRRKKAMLDILAWTHYNGENEDKHFIRACRALGMRLPTIEQAKRFSVESIPSSISFAIHKPWETDTYKGKPPEYAALCDMCQGLRELEQLQGTEE